MKRKKNSSDVNLGIIGIERFFSLSPAPRSKIKKPIRSPYNISGVDTPGTIPCTPSPALSLSHNSATKSPTASHPTPLATASPTSPKPVSPPPAVAAAAVSPSQQHAALLVASSRRGSAAAAKDKTRTASTPPGSPEVVCLTGSSDGGSDGSLVEIIAHLPDVKAEGKENGGGIASAASCAFGARGGASPSTLPQRPPPQWQVVSLEMTGYSLVGPAAGVGVGGPSTRHELPTGDIVVGRDSVRDKHKNNSNKMRMGIPSREEGISRSQATLRVCAETGRILVTHNKNAPNPTRIQRWAGSAGLSIADKERLANKRAKRSATATPTKTSSGTLPPAVVLGTKRQSLQDYLYPGDSLELDGFRSRGDSLYSFVLYPLPPGSSSMAGGGGSVGTPKADNKIAAKALGGDNNARVPAVAGSGAMKARGGPSTPGGKRVVRVGGRISPASARPGGLTPAGGAGGPATKAGRSPSTPTSAGKSGSAALLSVPGGGVAGRSPAVAEIGSRADFPLKADGLASGGGGILPDEGTFKKKLEMMSIGNSGAGGGGGIASSQGSTTTAPAAPSTTTGRLGCPSPPAPSTAMSGKRNVSPVALGAGMTPSGKKLRPAEEQNASAAAAASPSKYSHQAELLRTPSSALPISDVPGSPEVGPVSLSGMAGCSSGGAMIPPGAGEGEEGSGLIGGGGSHEGVEPVGVLAVSAACVGAGVVSPASISCVLAPIPAAAAAAATKRTGELFPPNKEEAEEEEHEEAASAQLSTAAAAAAEAVEEEEAKAPVATTTTDSTSAAPVSPSRSGPRTSDEVTCSTGQEQASAAAYSLPSVAGMVSTPPTKSPTKLSSSGGGGGGTGPGKGREKGGSGASAGGALWGVGDHVVLIARSGKGMNKPGGVARVVAVLENRRYSVKLVMGGKPTEVSADLLLPFSVDDGVDAAGCSPRGRRSRSCVQQSEKPQADPSNGWVPSTSSPSSSPSPDKDHGRRGNKISNSPARISTRTSTRTSSRTNIRTGTAATAAALSGPGDGPSSSPPPDRDHGRRGNKSSNSPARASTRTSARTSTAATAATEAALSGQGDRRRAARLGDRARVLYDETDWYMGTVVATHRGGAVTVRYDDGSQERVDLGGVVIDAEICADTALAPSPPASTASLTESPGPLSSSFSSSSSSLRSRGRGKNRRIGARACAVTESRGNADGSGTGGGGRSGHSTRVLGAGGRVLREDEGAVLTAARAGALLDTAPEKLVGLIYQEFHRPYGGWRETVVTEISEAPVGVYGTGDNEGLNPRWPQAVTVEQMYGTAEDDDGETEQTYSCKRRAGALLGRLRAWDKQREDLTESAVRRESEEGGGAGLPDDAARSRSASKEAALNKKNDRDSRSRSRSRSRDAQGPQAATAASRPARAKAASRAKSKAVAPAAGSKLKSAGTVNRGASGVAGGAAAAAAVGGDGDALARNTTAARKAAAEAEPRGRGARNAPTAVKVGEAEVARAAAGGKGAGSEVTSEEVEDKAVAKAKTISVKKQVALKRQAAASERELPTCPICGCEFFPTDRAEDNDGHLAVCSRKAAVAAELEAAAAAAAAAVAEEAATGSSFVPAKGEQSTTADANVGGKVAATGAAEVVAVATSSSPMSPPFARTLMFQLDGAGIGSVAAAAEEMAARGVRPTVALCDRVMQEMLKSRCRFQTEYLHRIMKNSLEAFPDCWQPLNWGRFEETLQRLAAEEDRVILNAHTATVDVILGCVEAYRRRRRWRGGGRLGAAGGERGGAAGQLPLLFLGAGGDRDGRGALKRCARWAAKAWERRGAAVLAGDEVETRVCAAMSRAVGEALEAFCGAGVEVEVELELEGCRLVAAELEGVGMTAPRKMGLLRSLAAGRPFRSTLAEVVLRSMPTEKGTVEVERLKALLWRQVGGGRKGAGARKMSGSAMLFADLAAG